MFFKSQISEGVKLLAESMFKHPENWVQGQYHFRCKSNPDIAIWTANGKGYIKLEGNDGFNLAEKSYINDAIKKSIALKIKMLSINDKETDK